MALAHAVGDKVEAVYRRSDQFEKRTRLMDAWAAFCSKKAKAGQVEPIRRADIAGQLGPARAERVFGLFAKLQQPAPSFRSPPRRVLRETPRPRRAINQPLRR